MRALSLGLLLALTGRLAALDLQPLVHVDLRGGLAGVEGQQQTPLVQGEVFAVPAVKFSEQSSLSPSLYFVGGGQERSLEETALFVRTASLGFRPQMKMHMEGDAVLTLTGDLRHAYNVEAVNESVGLGRYDYEDFALGLGWDSAFQGVPGGIGVRVDRRGYPNYVNIASEQTQPDNFHIKDFTGTQGEVHADLGVLGRLGASVELRNYSEALVLSEVDGQPTGQKQQDWLEDFSLKGGRSLNADGRLGLAWDLEWQGSQTNQNLFVVSPQAMGFAHADNYAAYVLGLSAQWRPSQTWTLMGSYTANFRNLDRPLQLADGTYEQGKIAEVEHDVSLGLRWPLASGLAAVGGVDAQFLLSNQAYAAAGIPSYNYYGANAGLQWDWKPGN